MSGQAPRTHVNVARESHASVIRGGVDSSFTPTVRIHLAFDWDDPERARRILREVSLEAEMQLEEIIAKVGRD